MEIKFGKLDESCKEYGIVQAPVLYNDSPSDYKAIIKDGELVAVLGENYRVLPNELAIKAAEEVASKVGAEPFKSKIFGGRHIAFNEIGTKMYATYLMPTEYDIAGKDTCRAGFTIMNGIDGTQAFSVSGFTFRKVCSNGVIMGQKKLTRFYRKHTKGFLVNTEFVVSSVEQVLERLKVVMENYAKLALVKLNQEIAQQIVDARFISRKFLPSYIVVEKGRLKEFDSNVSQWQVYNDITEAIWKNARTNLDSKRVQFDTLHKIIQV